METQGPFPGLDTADKHAPKSLEKSCPFISAKQRDASTTELCGELIKVTTLMASPWSYKKKLGV